MINSISKPFFEFLKLTPRYLVAVCIALAFLLFAPKNIIEFLSIQNFTQDYRSWISIIFIFTNALLAVTINIELTRRIKRWWRKRKFEKKILETLHVLTEDEKQILRYYIAKKTRSNVLKYDDGIVQGLASKGIIFRASSMGNFLEGFSYNIGELAWNHLNIYPDILEGTTNTYRTDRIKKWY